MPFVAVEDDKIKTLRTGGRVGIGTLRGPRGPKKNWPWLQSQRVFPLSTVKCTFMKCILSNGPFQFDKKRRAYICSLSRQMNSSKTDLLSHLWPPQIKLLQDHLREKDHFPLQDLTQRQELKIQHEITNGLSWSAKFFISSPTASFPLGASTLSSTWVFFNGGRKAPLC